MGVIQARNHSQVAGTVLQPFLAVDHQRQLTERHSVNSRDRQPTDSGLEFHIQHRAVNIEAVRVRAVKNDDLFPVSGAGLHQMMHCDIIGIVPKAYILNINHKDIKLIGFLLARNP